jgi:hypothetical protein
VKDQARTFCFLAARAYLAEFLKNLGAVVCGNPDAGIADAYFYSAGYRSRVYGDGSTFGREFNCVR